MERVEAVDGEFDLEPIRPREDGRFKRPTGSVAANADAEISGRGRLQIEGAHLEKRDVEDGVGLQLVKR